MVIRTNWSQIRKTNKENRKSNKKSSGKKFSAMWHFSKDRVDKIHFHRPVQTYINPFTGAEDAVKIIQRHWMTELGKFGRYVDHHDEQCVVCAYANPQAYDLDIEPDPYYAKDGKNPAPAIAVSGFVEGWFHLIEISRSDGTGTFPVREVCTGHGCEHCKAKAPKVFGKKVYFTFSLSQWLAVFSPLEEMASMYDRSGRRLLIFEYQCEECGEILVDFLNTCSGCGSDAISVDLDEEEASCSACGQTWSIYPFQNENLQSAIREEVRCSCGHTGYPKPVYDFAEEYDGEINQYDIFDLQMAIRKNDEGRLIVESWDIKEPNERLFDVQFQGNDREKAEWTVKGNSTPFDLDDILEPAGPAVQARILNKENPFPVGSHNVKRYVRTDEAPAEG